ncbi:MAG: YfbM family protein [Blastocatellales bacterium]
MSMICNLVEVDEDQLDDLLDDPEGILDLLDELAEEEAEETDLDKAWHGIHFLLTGSAWEGKEPLCYLVKGGKEVGDDEFGYGPARILRPEQVANWANALSTISADHLRKRFDPEVMAKAKIYPEIWRGDSEEGDPLEYLLDYYGELRSFVEEAKNANKGIIIYLS